MEVDKLPFSKAPFDQNLLCNPSLKQLKFSCVSLIYKLTNMDCIAYLYTSPSDCYSMDIIGSNFQILSLIKNYCAIFFFFLNY